MLQTNLFTKTRKETPKDEMAKNAKLLIQADFINKEMAGVYSYLPLGFLVLRKIEEIVRKEMNALDGQELLMPALHPKENWEKTGRWESLDVLYKVIDSLKRESALGPTHEEIVVPLVKSFVSSYRDLPFSVYHFQNKFRMEERSKSGILRGREFLMKDLYSFHSSKEDFEDFYEKIKQAYLNIFKEIGLGELTYLTFASGGTFSKFSHEFQTISETGEDTIYVCQKCRVAINKEIIEEQKVCPECGSSDLIEEKAVEVGNIFDLKNKFSKPFELEYKDQQGERKDVLMGCYGIGISRVMGTVVEVLSDEKGIVWPEAIAPFQIHLLSLGQDEKTKEIYEKLIADGKEVLYDDRDVKAGKKFADADLIGLPWRVVVSERSLKEGGVELKGRTESESKIVKVEELFK